jgi:adenylate cyclase
MWGGLLGASGLMLLGRLGESESRLSRALPLYRIERDNPAAVGPLTDPLVQALACAAQTRACLGLPEQSHAAAQQAIAHARAIAHPFSLGWALAFGALSQFLGFGHAMRGCALLEQGRQTQGIVELRHGIALSREAGVSSLQSFFFGSLASAQIGAGQIDAASDSIDHAASFMEMGERFYASELERLAGEIVAARSLGGADEAAASRASFEEPEARFERALDIARSQGALALELRAATSLVRSWRRRGDSDRAHALVAALRDRIGEQPESGSLADAAALFASNAP